jgi:hypothetical protein
MLFIVRLWRPGIIPVTRVPTPVVALAWEKQRKKVQQQYKHTGLLLSDLL